MIADGHGCHDFLPIEIDGQGSLGHHELLDSSAFLIDPGYRPK
jgi:hypothetical protein